MISIVILSIKLKLIGEEKTTIGFDQFQSTKWDYMLDNEPYELHDVIEADILVPGYFERKEWKKMFRKENILKLPDGDDLDYTASGEEKYRCICVYIQFCVLYYLYMSMIKYLSGEVHH